MEGITTRAADVLEEVKHLAEDVGVGLGQAAAVAGELPTLPGEPGVVEGIVQRVLQELAPFLAGTRHLLELHQPGQVHAGGSATIAAAPAAPAPGAAPADPTGPAPSSPAPGVAPGAVAEATTAPDHTAPTGPDHTAPTGPDHTAPTGPDHQAATTAPTVAPTPGAGA